MYLYIRTHKFYNISALKDLIYKTNIMNILTDQKLSLEFHFTDSHFKYSPHYSHIKVHQNMPDNILNLTDHFVNNMVILIRFFKFILYLHKRHYLFNIKNF